MESLSGTNLVEDGGWKAHTEKETMTSATTTSVEDKPQFMILVTGGRNFDNVSMAVKTLNSVVDSNPGRTFVLIHGAAYGADKIASGWAKSKGVRQIECLANWKEYGKIAGHIRNSQMVRMRPDICVVFPGGKGTNDCARKAREAGIPILDKRDAKYVQDDKKPDDPVAPLGS